MHIRIYIEHIYTHKYISMHIHIYGRKEGLLLTPSLESKKILKNKQISNRNAHIYLHVMCSVHTRHRYNTVRN